MSAIQDSTDKPTSTLRHRAGQTDQNMVPRASHIGYTRVPEEDDENVNNVADSPTLNTTKKAKDSNIRLNDLYDNNDFESCSTNLTSNDRSAKTHIAQTNIDYDSHGESTMHMDRVTLLENFNKRDPTTEETSCTIALQISFPFLIAGLGMVAAGLVLDKVQVWN